MSEEKKKTVEKTEQKEEKTMEIKPGMTVKVHEKIKEKNAKGVEKERIQIFEGIVLARKHNKEIGATITVRKVSNGIGVEKIFPLQSPIIVKIEPVKQAQVRRAKLGFLRKYKKKLKEVKL
ncbi:50S ribosomal protein L19 [bacterium]|jgi:large subunit ribosomal protein L19|nr:50S ribosomal protein L19 [bacterium]MBT4552695.1 50S ribosomal protein L19 [bacterium]